MTYLIRFKLDAFIKDLQPGSTVYSVAFTDHEAPKTRGFVLLTSVGGNVGGTIHAVRLRIEPDNGDAANQTLDILYKLDELLKLEDMTIARGVLLTEGLVEDIKAYGNVDPTSLKDIEDLISRKKEQQNERR